MWRVALVLALLGACIDDGLVPCGTLACPAGNVCTTVKTCATPEQAQACFGLATGASCVGPEIPSGTCSDGVCIPIACGNGLVQTGEACDDGNQVAGDGCSADCQSKEQCGNQIIDSEVGEDCDESIAGLSNDGCSSVCTNEIEIWQLETPQSRGSAFEMPMVFDTARGVAVGWGLLSLGAATNVINEWNGYSWLARPYVDVDVPAIRIGYAGAYDTKHARAVFGMGTQQGTPNVLRTDMWTWDGTHWMRLADVPSVEGGTGYRMVYDQKREVLVLVGPDGTTYENTGEPDATWVLKNAATPVRTNFSLAYDVARKVTVMFGGSVTSLASAEVYEYAGSTWTKKTYAGTPPAVPAAQADAAITYVPDAGVVIVDAADANAVTWAWNGTTWTKFGTVALTHMTGAALAYDSVHDEIVRFGGCNPVGGQCEVGQAFGGMHRMPMATMAWQSLESKKVPDLSAAATYDAQRGVGVSMDAAGDIWELNDVSWVEASQRLENAAQIHNSALAYDPTRHEVVAFAGNNVGGIYTSTTRVWTGAGWDVRAPDVAPTARVLASLAPDPDGRLVMFGGKTPSTYLGDTWFWDGTTWLQGPPGPPARTQAGMAYDPVRKRTVLFGGSDLRTATFAFGDTWEWDGELWHDMTPLAPALSPPARTPASLSYDPQRQRVVLTGGYSVNGVRGKDTWEWDGTAWVDRTGFSAPQTRLGGASFYDARRKQLIDSIDSNVYTRSFRTPSRALDLCDGTTDGDRDGLVGCADPDCWSVCWPDCPPGVSCPDDAMRCGDHTCSALESHALCPSDCP